VVRLRFLPPAAHRPLVAGTGRAYRNQHDCRLPIVFVADVGDRSCSALESASYTERVRNPGLRRSRQDQSRDWTVLGRGCEFGSKHVKHILERLAAAASALEVANLSMPNC
jgi:hypothetical protein